MKFLVTGGAGFIGGHLVQELLKNNHEVHVVDDESALASDSFNWFEECKNYKFSILEKEKLETIFKNGIDYVFHLAAETKIQLALENPSKCFDVNINGTLNILELSKKYNVKRVILASTSAIYGMNTSPNTETQEPDILNPYSSSKLCGEILCKTYTNVYGLETVSFRFFNVYGERMPNKGFYAPVIAVFKKQKNNNETLTITGDGEQRRDFIYVGDVVSGLIAGAFSNDKNILGNVYNLGSGTNFSINDIAKIFNFPFIYTEKRVGDARETLADISKTKKYLYWEPKTVLLDWIKNYLR